MQHLFQIVLLVLAVYCAYHGWHVPAPYGGDAGLGDAFEKLISYAVAAICFVAAFIWYIVGK